MKYELRQMCEQGSGAIVNCSSIGGLTASPTRAIYAVCPGSIKTPMVDDMLAKGWIAMEDMVNGNAIKRLGRPEEIASAVLWLCSPGASFVIGHALVVDGGAIA
jgi:enoyl-[acyl-carrier-protein] reductase (NADH)